MSENLPPLLKLNPWVSSSLLQKAIRRGEVELALCAARAFYRYRGVAIFRRLCTIAVEDIGVGDIGLLQDIARLTADKELRSVLGSDIEIALDLCSRMASATKDRSADYLYCAATLLESARLERRQLADMQMELLIQLAADAGAPLIRRASAALLACTVDGQAEPILVPDRVERLLDNFGVKPLPLHDAVLQFASIRAQPFCLMLPLIWSRWWHDGAECEIVDDELAVPEFVAGVPLYVLDKHTAAGKQAIRRFARENGAVASALQRWVPEHRRSEVAQIAAFYADASPVTRRLKWSTGSLLEQMGTYADMTDAGCEFDGVQPILECLRANLTDLNQLRREELRAPRVCRK